MRRIAAILVTIAINLSLIAPLLPMGAEAQLPACCRRDGKHGCGMKKTAAPHDDHDAVAAVRTACPAFPSAHAVPMGSAADVPMTLVMTAPVHFGITPVEQAESRYRISYARASQKRGPPSLLS